MICYLIASVSKMFTASNFLEDVVPITFIYVGAAILSLDLVDTAVDEHLTLDIIFLWGGVSMKLIIKT